jgi:hypothetical protein
MLFIAIYKQVPSAQELTSILRTDSVDYRVIAPFGNIDMTIIQGIQQRIEWRVADLPGKLFMLFNFLNLMHYFISHYSRSTYEVIIEQLRRWQYLPITDINLLTLTPQLGNTLLFYVLELPEVESLDFGRFLNQLNIELNGQILEIRCREHATQLEGIFQSYGVEANTIFFEARSSIHEIEQTGQQELQHHIDNGKQASRRRK